MAHLDLVKKIREPVFYVTNDVGRGIGLENLLPNYHIVCLDEHPLVTLLQKAGVSVFCLEREIGKRNTLFRSSSTVLSHPAVISFIKVKARGVRPRILFFKPQKKMEILAREHGFNLIGNPVDLNRLFEDKLTFYKICLKESIPVPEGEIVSLSKTDFPELEKKFGLPFVIQFGRGWAGNSTYFITSQAELWNLQKKFPAIEVKITRFIKGLTVLNNACIYNGQVLAGKPALQIKADAVLTAQAGGTGGRQWPIDLTKDQKSQIDRITDKTGKLMAKAGYKGFFGLDFLVAEKTGQVYLSENNARLTASSSFFTKLELGAEVLPLLGYHLLSFLPSPAETISYQAPAVSGSEIIGRNTADFSISPAKMINPGIYNSELDFMSSAYCLDSKEQSGFWIETAAASRAVNPEIEIFKINSWKALADKNGSLTQKALDLVKNIRARLHLTLWQG